MFSAVMSRGFMFRVLMSRYPVPLYRVDSADSVAESDIFQNGAL